MTSIAFYDHRADPAVNATASEAIEYINQLFRENARPSFCLQTICFWSAQAVAPDVGLARQLEMARLAQAQVRDVMARLQHVVAA
jgi:hypothetical protein